MRILRKFKNFLIPALGGTVLGFAMFTTTNCEHSHNAFNCVEYVRNYDGDTVTFNIPNVPDVIGRNMPVRVNGIDCPEINSREKCEHSAAIKARNIVEELLKDADRIDLENVQRGKYFRIVADIVVDDISLSKLLLEKGLAYPYNGGKKKRIDWCSRVKLENI